MTWAKPRMPGPGAGDPLPGAAVIGGHVDVGLEVAEGVAIEGRVGGRPDRSGLASIHDTQDDGGTPVFLVRLVQLRPPSRVSWTLPSSVPTQIRPACLGDSLIA